MTDDTKTDIVLTLVDIAKERIVNACWIAVMLVAFLLLSTQVLVAVLALLIVMSLAVYATREVDELGADISRELRGRDEEERHAAE